MMGRGCARCAEFYYYFLIPLDGCFRRFTRANYEVFGGWFVASGCLVNGIKFEFDSSTCIIK